MDIRAFFGKTASETKTQSKTKAETIVHSDEEEGEFVEQEKAWNRRICCGHPTWKMVVERTGPRSWKYSLYEWVASKRVWNFVDYEGMTGNPDNEHIANVNIPGLEGELRVVYDDGEVNASVVFTDDNDDGPCLYFFANVVEVEMK